MQLDSNSKLSRRGVSVRPVYVTTSQTWARWAGHPEEITRSAEIAAGQIETWTGVPGSFKVSIDRGHSLGQYDDRLDSIADLQPHEMADVQSITVDVEVEWDDFYDWRDDPEHTERKGMAKPVGRVKLQLGGYKSSIDVVAEDRAGAEGLLARLTGELGRNAGRSIRGAVWAIGAVGSFLLMMSTSALIHATKLAPQNNILDPIEIVGIAASLCVGIVLTASYWWAFPNFELVPNGRPSRAKRWRAQMIGVSVAVAISLVTGAIVAVAD